MTSTNTPARDNDGSTSRKVVLVTGASSDIGAAIAIRLAAEGHLVVATARRVERLGSVAATARDAGHQVIPRVLDVTDRKSYGELVAGIVREHGRLDVLIGNAGAMLLSQLDALLVEEWDRMIDVNVRGLLNGFAATLPHFTATGGGHIITIASIGAHQVVGTSAVYSATKYAAWALTEGLRLESDPSIRVTTISPGVVESELADQITDPYAANLMTTYRAAAIQPDAIAQAISYAIGQPSDVDVNEIIVRPTRQR